jgi:2-dehydropantoate 2-reductase
MSSSPRIAIYGAGMVGNYLGGRLHGHAQLRFIARPHIASMLQEHGLTVSDLHGHRRHVPVAELDVTTQASGAQGVDAVLVTVKSAATMDVAHDLAEVLAPGTLVISFQNGVRNVADLRAALPTCHVLAGMVPFNVAQPVPGHFHQGSSGALMVERSAALSPALRAAFDAGGLPLQVCDDMQAVLWAKLLINLNNALNALSGLPLREQLAQRPWRQCLALLQREGLRVLHAAGIRPAALTALPARWLPDVLALPDALFHRIASRMLAIDPLARSSMWDDLQAHRRTEVDYINGELVALAKSRGLRAPANERIVALIREAEQSPVPWTPYALLKTLRNA